VWDELAKLLAISLFNDIISGQLTVEGARKAHAVRLSSGGQ